MTAADLLNPIWIPEYESQRNALERQLRELNTMMFILEKLEMFPFWLFTPSSYDYMFWRTIKVSLIETTLMIASRAILDVDGDALTLRHYKNDVLRNTIDENARKTVIKQLQSVNFDARIADIEAKIRPIRNNFLAHLNKLQNTLEPDKRTIENVTFGEMRELLTAAYDLFNALSFGDFFVPWWTEYNDSVRNAQQTDIDRLLDSVAKNSTLLNLPELNPQIWQRHRATLTDDDLEKLNEYRKKFGLPEVD